MSATRWIANGRISSTCITRPRALSANMMEPISLVPNRPNLGKAKTRFTKAFCLPALPEPNRPIQSYEYQSEYQSNPSPSLPTDLGFDCCVVRRHQRWHRCDGGPQFAEAIGSARVLRFGGSEETRSVRAGRPLPIVPYHCVTCIGIVTPCHTHSPCLSRQFNTPKANARLQDRCRPMVAWDLLLQRRVVQYRIRRPDYPLEHRPIGGDVADPGMVVFGSDRTCGRDKAPERERFLTRSRRPSIIVAFPTVTPTRVI